MKRYPLFCIREHLCIPERTLRPIYRVLTWSFNDTCIQFSESFITDLDFIMIVDHHQSLVLLSQALFDAKHPCFDVDGGELPRHMAKRAGSQIDGGYLY